MIASLEYDFNTGLLSLATAKSSLSSLYNPTVVIYTFGSLKNVGWVNEPSEPVAYVGLELKLYFLLLTLQKKFVELISSSLLTWK